MNRCKDCFWFSFINPPDWGECLALAFTVHPKADAFIEQVRLPTVEVRLQVMSTFGCIQFQLDEQKVSDERTITVR